MTPKTVYVVDDEPMVRDSVARLLRADGFDVETFASGDALLAELKLDRPACVLVDLAMPEMDGLTLQRRLVELNAGLSIVFLTGHGDIPASVRAVRSGAIDFLTKPVRRDVLLAAVRAALLESEQRFGEALACTDLNHRYQRLTPREREVLTHVVAGKMNKVIATELGTSEQTIKVHRRRVMHKLGAGSVAELVRIAQRLGIEPAAEFVE